MKPVYTAVVIVDGVPFIARAYKDKNRIQEEVQARKAWLGKVQYLYVEPGAERGDADKQNITRDNSDCGALYYLISRLLEGADINPRGADALIVFNKKTRFWVRKKILEAARLLDNAETKRK